MDNAKVTELEKMDIDLESIKPEHYEGAVSTLLRCFDDRYLDPKVRYIGYIFEYLAIYLQYRLDAEDEGTFDTLLTLLQARDKALYQAIGQEVC